MTSHSTDGAVKIVECPRDAWQGLPQVIPTQIKAKYLCALVEAGFRHIDAVSFVSPQHVRQMADSEAVLEAFYASLPSRVEAPEIIGIVVNEKGIERALAAPGVTTLGYPYSISAYFRRANANMSRAESRALVEQLRKATKEAGRGLVVYVSMAFGNPYEEPWGPEIVEDTLDLAERYRRANVFHWPIRWEPPRPKPWANCTPRSRIASPVSNWASIFTAGPKAQRKK